MLFTLDALMLEFKRILPVYLSFTIADCDLQIVVLLEFLVFSNRYPGHESGTLGLLCALDRLVPSH